VLPWARCQVKLVGWPIYMSRRRRSCFMVEKRGLYYSSTTRPGALCQVKFVDPTHIQRRSGFAVERPCYSSDLLSRGPVLTLHTGSAIWISYLLLPRLVYSRMPRCVYSRRPTAVSF
jgi:hypothetical protein